MPGQDRPDLSFRHVIVLVLAVMAALATLWMMGRVPVSASGLLKVWASPWDTNETSQQLTDIYSLSHIIHGFLFYFGLWLVFPRMPVGSRLILATGIECAWEIFENSQFIIDRYRERTVSFNYEGDSVFNSFGDIFSMIAGFLLAWRAPAWVTIALGIAFELIALYIIRDNLTLNIIMLLWPVEAIKNWQAGVQL